MNGKTLLLKYKQSWYWSTLSKGVQCDSLRAVGCPLSTWYGIHVYLMCV